MINKLSDFNVTKIIIEQPLLGADIIKDERWILSKIYHDPLGAYKFFVTQRRSLLRDSAKDNNLFFIPSLFDDLNFTPSEYSLSFDHFHTNEKYGKLLIDKIFCLLK